MNSVKSSKTEFIYVKPKSKKAKNRFDSMMNGLHSCRVENRKDGKVFLASISGKYFFSMNESADDDWTVIKQYHGEVIMILFSLLLATHVPQEQYLRCKDYEWLTERTLSSEILSVSQKIDFITRWLHHTDPKCFEDKE